MNRTSIISVHIRTEMDVVLARQRARIIAAMLGFDRVGATRIATAVSEIARNAFNYAGGGKIEFAVAPHSPRQQFQIVVTDTGSGIPDVKSILDGTYESATGMGLGILGSRRVSDSFDIKTSSAGTIISLEFQLPPSTFGVDEKKIKRIVEELAGKRGESAIEELQQQNQEVLRLVDEVLRREEEHVRLNRELEDTNRGVVALYAELDQRADELKRANQLRAQFMSYMSHEFRTPLDSIIALSALLLQRVDGELTSEQEKQVGFVQRSARDLLNMVDDLLDSARADAGQLTVRANTFYVADLFNALRATMRPLLTNAFVALNFEDETHNTAVYNDDAKISQVLRNFISNALKFTEVGEVSVHASIDGADTITFRVKDTGIGIGLEDHERIFRDFAQVESPAQRRVKGTGLGLPLSRKFAELLGGRVWVESQPGRGSTFAIQLPLNVDNRHVSAAHD